ncbi:hypothetical protein BKA65DRAFT_507672 [Rhexocercosporidium sp. MPI-PUGE-AT-0058]|nr:hypothetical protein BKA65DRAFT_507672 [Rhexocercosporidium sp. MPI-PUGE-AT-0058]
MTCDRCHRLKSKCIFPPTASTCHRCDRLGHRCESRTAHRRGRKPKGYIWAVTELWSKDFIDSFVIGPSFSKSFKHNLKASYDPVLQGACMAITAVVHGGSSDTLSLISTTTALQHFRQFNLESYSQLAAFSGVGLCIVTFEVLTACTFPYAVLTHALLSIKPWYPVPWEYPDLECHLHCLMLMDTISSLLLRQLPIIRYVGQRTIVDRALGLSCNFLPILYDLCDAAKTQKDLSPIELAVSKWHSDEPPDFEKKFSKNEVMSMRRQASVYQHATLLFIYRLKYPFWRDDDIGLNQARQILLDLDVCFRAMGEYPLTSFFPFLVAALELDHPSERGDITIALEERFRPVFKQYVVKLRQLIESVWRIRDVGGSLTWDQVTQLMPTMFYLP